MRFSLNGISRIGCLLGLIGSKIYISRLDELLIVIVEKTYPGRRSISKYLLGTLFDRHVNHWVQREVRSCIKRLKGDNCYELGHVVD